MNPFEHLRFGWGNRLPMVLQGEAAECGLACLAMISGYHGQGADLAALRRQLAVSLKGVNLREMIGMAERIALVARPLRLELDELPLLRTPCILHWDLNHFVVLHSVGKERVVIHDPAIGVRHLAWTAVSRHFTGIALELTPAPDFEPVQAPPRVRLSSLLGRLIGIRQALFKLFTLALAIELFTVVSPLFLQWVVDQALVAADFDLLATLAFGFTLLLFLKTAVAGMRGWMLIGLTATAKVQGQANLFSHLIGLPAGYFEARHLGDVMSRFSSQESILQAITGDVVETVLDGLLAVVTLVIMFLFAPGLAALVLCGALAYGLLLLAAYPPLRQISMESIVWGARRDSHFLETLRGIKTVKLFNAQETRHAHWLSLLVETINRQLAAQNLRLVFRTANGLVVGLLAILVIWLGARQVLANSLSVGMLLAFIAYKDQFLLRISNLINKTMELSMLRLHAERLSDIALTAPEPREPGDLESPVGSPVAVEVKDLRFRYGESEKWIVDGLSFRVAAGESVAIAGPSGCGKTTVLKILASLLQPEEGEILVDGEPLKRLGRARWRSMIAVVMQDDQLFAGSLADNISFFAERPDYGRIEGCARQAGIHDDIVAMPMAYHTLVGDMGTVLSGGQKQRVLIARALYRQPRLLLMDEATSHLDLALERSVAVAIRDMAVTRIIVAHRPETLHSADRVIHLEAGCIAAGVDAWRTDVALADYDKEEPA